MMIKTKEMVEYEKIREAIQILKHVCKKQDPEDCEDLLCPLSTWCHQYKNLAPCYWEIDT